jgi:hypothetical protein
MVQALLDDIDAVLVDLRGLTAHNGGVLTETEYLVASVPLQKVIAVLDDSTDLGVLQWVLDRAAGAGPAYRRCMQKREAQSRYIGFVQHAFPRCFTCGPERLAGDGLRIFPGSAGDDGVVAAVWEPDPSLAGTEGAVDAATLWAALDCPSGIAVIAASGKPAVLGRMGVVRHAPVVAGRPHVVVGWPRQGAGRRSLPAGSALFTESGELVAQAEAVWVSVAVPFHDTAAAGAPADRQQQETRCD